MKSIKLQISQSFSVTLDTHNITEDDITEINGKRVIKIGSINVAEHSKDMDTARDNGAQIVYATTSVEKQLESLLLLYFFGPITGPGERRDFFFHNMLQSSGVSYLLKKELVLKIVNKYSLLKGKKKNELSQCLKKIMDWRNAFAHGRLEHNNQLGVLLRFFSGSPAYLELNDEYWLQVEECFESVQRLIKSASEELGRYCKSEASDQTK